MPKILYVSRKFAAATQALITKADSIIGEYAEQGFELTLRQLYYQFVARGIINNSQQEYNRLGSIINDARLAGLLDWEAIVDRTRNLRSNSHWSSPADIVKACADQYQIDKWKGQEYRVEVWIEKDALVGIVESVCVGEDVPYFSCRGYTSQSEMWGAAQRLIRYSQAGQKPVVIHLGDHDPSGKDMTRDIQDRIRLFMEYENAEAATVHRIALNMDQVRRYNPPPNPAKITDSRAKGYIREFGDKSWELDALDPRTLSELIKTTIRKYRDDETYGHREEIEETHKGVLAKAALRMIKQQS